MVEHDAAVVIYEQGSPVLAPNLMEQGRPYPILLGGHWLAVVRHADGRLDFHAIDRPPPAP